MKIKNIMGEGPDKRQISYKEMLMKLKMGNDKGMRQDLLNTLEDKSLKMRSYEKNIAIDSSSLPGGCLHTVSLVR